MHLKIRFGGGRKNGCPAGRWEDFAFMKRITTVCGDIAPENLGFTDMHEHIMFNGADMGAICRPAMPTDLPVKYEDKVSLENIGF